MTTGSSNIHIGNFGFANDSALIRIGAVGVHQGTLIAGIHNATAAAGIGVFVNGNGQLGTLTSSGRFKEDVLSVLLLNELQRHQRESEARFAAQQRELDELRAQVGSLVGGRAAVRE